MKSNYGSYGIDTLAVRAGYMPEIAEHCMIPPIYQTNAYELESVEYAKRLFELKEAGNIYSRLNNPTVTVLEERLTALEGGVGAVAMASGHAVIFNTLLNLAVCGDEVVSSLRIYGGAINMMSITLGNLGIKVRFVDPDDFDAWEDAINEKTKALFVEMLGNPNANPADLDKFSSLARRHGIPLIVDSTMTTPYLIRPFEHGADIVIHSATKYLCGQGSSMAGVVVDSGNFKFKDNERFPQYNTPDISYHGVNFGADCGNAGFVTRLRALFLRDVGACLSPFNAFLTLTGIETLCLRMRRHCDNALEIARFLENHPAVEFVNYPLLESNKYYDIARKYLPKGAGACYTIGLKGGKEACVRFMDSLKLFHNVANLGDTRSMVSHPATTTHSQLNEEQLAACGITGGTVRLSIGIEDTRDLIADLEQAIAAANAGV